MNRAQKIALFMVIMTSTGVIAACIAFAVLYSMFGMPKVLAGFAFGFAFIGIAGLAGFSPLIFRKDKGKVRFDEHDRLIKRRTALAGFATSYLFVGLACMIPFSILGPKASISVIWLPHIFGGAALSSFFVHSVAILIQYGRGGKNHE